VVFTSVEATLAALRKAGDLAGSLGARIALIVPLVVPYPLPLDNPAIQNEWNTNRFQELARQSPIETTVVIYLCRDRLQTLTAVLRSSSIVVVGCKKKPWSTPESRLARKLRTLGHEVILAEASN